jgi:hypothetical protein
MILTKRIWKLLSCMKRNSNVVELTTEKQEYGNALISYGIKIFKDIRKGKGFSLNHSTGWEIYTISQILLDFGYNVDVIDYTNKKFIPKKEYSILVDVHSNLERLAPLLPKHCIKIFHPCWSHWIHHNQAIYKRLSGLRERRNIILKPTKLIQPNFSAEMSDYITQRGHGFTAETYAFTNKPTFSIRHSTQCEYDRPLNKNYNDCRKNFLWLGGYGCVSKGLDLLLDVFSELTDYNLYVCGRLFQEPDFETAFNKELYSTKNIKNLGFIDVSSEEFKQLARKCIALIYPSSTELSSGAVITSMHAGLIPVISKECGVNVGDFGLVLKKCSADEIKETILKLSCFSTEDLAERSMKAWKHANEHHTKEGFEKDFRNALLRIIEHRSEF